MKYSKHPLKLWFFRILVIAACCLMITAFTMPWWTAQIGSEQGVATLNIYGWGFHPQRGLLIEPYITEDITPTYQIQLAWTYVGISALAAIAGGWLRGKKGQFLLVLSGVGLVTYALIAAFMVITNRLNELGITLQGMSSIGPATIDSSLCLGFYLSCITGGLFIALAIIKPLIGKG